MKKLFALLLCLASLLNTPTLMAGVHEWAQNSVLSEGNWTKIALNTPHDGVYQITYSQLSSWGFSKPELVGVYGFGGHELPESFAAGHIDDLPEVAVYHDNKRQRLLFFAQGLIEWTLNGKTDKYVQRQNTYSTQSCYFLRQKDEASLAISEAPETDAEAELTVNEYDEFWLHEQELANLGQTGRQWYGESFLNTQYQSFTLPEEPHLAGHSFVGDATCEVVFVTKAGASSSILVKADNQELVTSNIPATTGTYSFGTEVTAKGTLTATAGKGTAISITYKPGTSNPTVARLNYIRMQGQCALEASSKEPFLLFRNKKALGNRLRYAIGGMTSDMQVWDVTSAIVPERLALADDAGKSCFTAAETGLRQYAVVNTAHASFPGVSRVGKVANQNLHSLQPVDFVIVTASAFYQQARELAEYRLEHDGLESIVVTPELIYNEYSSGRPDVTAIRLFLKQLYDRGAGSEHQLRYLLLMGDGTYANRMAGVSTNHLLTYQSESSLVETSSCVTDDYFGFLDDDEGGKTDGNGRYSLSSDRLDIGIGRLTVSSVSEATEMVAKIKRYDSESQRGNWKNRLCFISDDDKIESSGTDSPNLHMRHNEQLIKSMIDAGHHDYIYQKIYLPAYKQVSTASGHDYPDARKELNNTLQQGALLVNFAGHGAYNLITHEQIVNTKSASEMRLKHLPVWITASCDVSRFDASTISMGEALLLNPNGGAAALISTTRVVYAQQNLNLNQAIINHIFDRNADGSRFRMGDILRAAKVSLGSDYNKLNFCLLGDPTMTLAYPEQEMVIDKVEGKFEALSTVTLKGRVLKTGSKETDTDYNGLVYSAIYDAEETIAANKGLYQDPVLNFSVRKRKIFSGRDEVKSGEFEFSFMVPQDISGLAGNGLVNLYACSEDGAEAQGYFDDFSLSGSSLTSTDETAPEILSCFLDDPSFATGGKVGKTPFFYAEVSDDSGINATGNGIGHDIALYIRCLSNPMLANRQIVLNDYFTTFTGQSNHGNIKYSLPELEEGTYEATFRVWDVCNNESSRTFTFTVTSGKAAHIAMMQAYPSPARQGEPITFRVLHNRPESADMLRVQVFTQTGVKVFDQTATSSSCEVVYLKDGAENASQINHSLNADETDELYGASSITWNAALAPGVYVYKAYLTAGGSETTTQSKLLMILGQ